MSAAARALALALLLVAATDPVGAGGDEAPGPDERYLRYETVLEHFARWETTHADVFHRETIGTTHGGEGIVAARIGRPDADGPPPPTLLFLGALHANEPLGTNVIVRLMRTLLDGHAEDGDARRWVDGLACWFVPVVNVDGHRRVFDGAERWRDWRKNARDNDADGRVTFRADGVDLNRNWDHRWEEDLSTNPRKRSYKGPRPFSEPEVVALRDLVLRLRPLIVVDYHSPGTVTLPNRVFWPWYEKGEDRNGPDAAAYRGLARALARAMETEEDGVFYRSAYAYDTLPKAQNWIYGTTGACALLVELSTKSWWQGPVVDTIAERATRGGPVLLDRALDGPGLAVRVTDAATRAPLEATVRVEAHHDPRVGPRRTDPKHGLHRRLLLPGRYTLVIEAEGYLPARTSVRVAQRGWTRLEVPCSAAR